MKTVFSNSELPHIWAAQNQTEGRAAGNSFFFRNRTIFSYGHHFPIATLLPGGRVLFTLRSYSNTTAKHIGRTRRAVSHLKFIYCRDVIIDNGQTFEGNKNRPEHKGNVNYFKGHILRLFSEIGNPRNRNKEGRISEINSHIKQLQEYCSFFDIKLKDKELNAVIEKVNGPEFIKEAEAAAAVKLAAEEKKTKQAAAVYDKYLNFWRADNIEAIQNMTDKEKTLINFYRNRAAAFTHLRFNKEKNRVETSKGIQIPAEIAREALDQLGSCINSVCKGLNIKVLHYTITETTKEAIIAGCHTIPKTDVLYIAKFLNC